MDQEPGVWPVKNALLSVYYKDGIIEMAQKLLEGEVNLYSSGGTARTLKEAGLPVTEVAIHTGYPALFGHRVVTLHPKIHGGILYRRDNAEDIAEAMEHEIIPFDLVVGNLYPVKEAIEADKSIDEVVELTDIGGPAMIRSAAKNHKHVAVVVDPRDYMTVANRIQEQGGVSLAMRRALATKAFATTAHYDALIVEFYKKHFGTANEQAGLGQD